MAAKLMLIASVLLVVGSLLLLWFLIRLARRVSYYSQTRRVTRAPRGVSMWSIISAIILLLFSWLFFWTGHQLKEFSTYRPLARVCRIDVQKNDDPVKSMKFTIWPPGDTSKSPLPIYLSGNAWYMRGQYIHIKGILGKLFPAPYGFRITDLYGGYAGNHLSANEQSTLIHQLIEGGTIDLDSYLETMNFLRKYVQLGEFETQMVGITPKSTYWIVLSDSGVSRVEMAAGDPGSVQ